jgi:dihydrolipoamide dehydrogenase
VADRSDDTSVNEYDVIVLGAGPTGENVAGRTAKAGLKTAIVEADLVGGSCSYWACIPSKVLLRSPELLAHAKQLTGVREAVTGNIDAAAVLARRDSFTGKGDDSGQADWVRDAGITLLRGKARLSGIRKVQVTDTSGTMTLRARHAVALCVGSQPAIPDIPGLVEARPWTNREATSAEQVPGRLLVLGGGAVGCELAVAWQALGSAVHLVQRSDRLLTGYEPEISNRVEVAMRSQGVTLRTGVSVEQAERLDDGSVIVTLSDGSRLHGDELLVAVGRIPCTTDLGMELVGLKPGDRIRTDDAMRVAGVAGDWLYAAGDCTDRAALTHMGKYQARACSDTIAAATRGELPGGGDLTPYSAYTATADHHAVPQVVFTIPQAAAVGLTEDQARERGVKVATVDHEIGNVTGASLHLDGYNGYAKLVIDASREVIVGASFVGPDVAELLHAATIAVVGEIPLQRLWHAVPAFPTMSEVWLRLLETYGL